jgi:hypothetical protein
VAVLVLLLLVLLVVAVAVVVPLTLAVWTLQQMLFHQVGMTHHKEMLVVTE